MERSWPTLMKVGPSMISVSRRSTASFLRAAMNFGSVLGLYLNRRFTIATLMSCLAAHLHMR